MTPFAGAGLRLHASRLAVPLYPHAVLTPHILCGPAIILLLLRVRVEDAQSLFTAVSAPS